MKRLATPSRRALVLLGPRQVGKTVVLHQLVEELVKLGVPPANVVFFDFSDERVAALEASPDDVIAQAPPLHGPRFYLFDEITSGFPRNSSWASWLKRTVDRLERNGDRFVLTDSSAPLLRGGRESGLGRWDELHIEPLSYAEFLDLNALGSESRRAAAARMTVPVDFYLAVGGFPEHAIGVSPDRLSIAREQLREDIANKAIYRDLARTGLDTERVHGLFVFLLEDSGSIFDPVKRGRLLDSLGSGKAVDHRSLKAWLDALVDGMLVARLEPFAKGAAGKLSSRAYPKYYAADAGLVTAFAFVAEPLADPGVRARAVEAAVFRHLREVALATGAHLSFARGPAGDSEIDFLLSLAADKVAVEVKSGVATDKHLTRLTAAAARWKSRKAVLVHAGETQSAEGVTLLSLPTFLESPLQVWE